VKAKNASLKSFAHGGEFTRVPGAGGFHWAWWSDGQVAEGGGLLIRESISPPFLTTLKGSSLLSFLTSDLFTNQQTSA
jgi:hypothetical protein